MVVDILIPLCEGLVSAKERIGRGEGGVYYCLPVLKVANNNSTTLLLLVQQKMEIAKVSHKLQLKL